MERDRPRCLMMDRKYLRIEKGSQKNQRVCCEVEKTVVFCGKRPSQAIHCGYNQRKYNCGQQSPHTHLNTTPTSQGSLWKWELKDCESQITEFAVRLCFLITSHKVSLDDCSNMSLTKTALNTLKRRKVPRGPDLHKELQATKKC